MKNYRTTIMGLIFTVLVSISVASVETSVDTNRWDADMIKEIDIWKNFHVYEWTGNIQYWEQKKTAMDNIINNYPDSQWVDDAMLILACGMADYEDDKQEAIRILKKIVNADNGNSKASTIILPLWPKGQGCQIDSTWIEWSKKLIRRDPSGAVNGVDFGNKDTMNTKQKEILNYFDHLRRYPVYTKVIAAFFLSGLLDDKEQAIENKLKILTESKAYLIEYTKQDSAAFESGVLSKGITRPEYWVYISAASDLIETEDASKALLIAAEFNEIVKESIHWGMNEQLGDIYFKLGQRDEAKLCYNRALDLLDKHQGRSQSQNSEKLQAEAIRNKLNKVN